jgi:hypothetical protein
MSAFGPKRTLARHAAMSASDPKQTLADRSSSPGRWGGVAAKAAAGRRSSKNRKVSEPSHSPINEAVIDFAYEKWRRVMLVILPPLKIQIRVSRPRKVGQKAVGKPERSPTMSEP